ncbi:MAG: helix-hairpin-helix domain-containing protein [Chlamydiae bacterium]|nr:helix-hairpin-helix domain-containing protein [Chlamydiota bacterium]MBI3276875.1 helix-hairpin-helix domain-containing protein [Chlamydiota bacterium]
MDKSDTPKKLTPPTPLTIRGVLFSPLTTESGYPPQRVDEESETSQSGAALILALGILSLITVLAVAFAVVMRSEEKAGRNSFYLIQARQIANAAMQYTIAILDKDLTNDQLNTTPSNLEMYDSYDEEWFTLFSSSISSDPDLDGIDLDGDGTIEKEKWIYVHQNSNGTGPIIGRYAIRIQDEAGKLNINAAGPGTQNGVKSQNEGWTPYEISLYKEGEIILPGIGDTHAAAIVNYRYGADLEPGANATGSYQGDDNNNKTALGNDRIDNDGDETSDELNEGLQSPTEFDPEIPYGDDRPFGNLEELLKVSGIGSSTVDTLKNYATVWSYDTNSYYTGSTWAHKINLNHLLSTAQLYSILIAPDSTTTSQRMAANIIDFLDRDVYPTVTTSSASSPSSSNSYMGLEGLQFNEVMTKSSNVLKLYNQSELAWPGDWVTDSVNGYDHGNNDGGEGQWAWYWDRGTYQIQVTQTGATNISFNGIPATDTNGDSYYDVSVPGDPDGGKQGRIDLTMIDPVDSDSNGDPINATFTSITIKSGKFMEIINLSRQNINFDVSEGSSWKVVFGDNLTSPISDGQPLTAVTSSNQFALTTAWNVPATLTLTGHLENSSTYNYLLVADSLYALDIKFGDGNGSWGNSSDLTKPERGTLIASSVVNELLLDGGTNLALADGSGNVIAFVPTSGSQWGVQGYGASTNPDYSVYRISPVQATKTWTDSAINGQPTPGSNNSSMSSTDFYVKDRPLASLGEIGEVFIGTSNNNTYDTDSTSNSNSNQIFNQLTLVAKRLEAEDGTSQPSWNIDNSCGSNICGSDGTTQYVGSGSGPWTWSWRFDIGNASDLTKPFRFRNSDSATAFDVLTYSQFGVMFQSPSGTIRDPKPNHSATVNSTSITNNTVSIQIAQDGSTPPKLDYVVLTPEPYTWGKININTASKNVLMSLSGIGSSTADNIISYRINTSHFHQIQEITGVSGIGESDFQEISNLITVRSDVYRIIIRAESITDTNHNNVVDSGENISTVNLTAIVDRNPSMRFPGTRDRYRIEQQRYEYN